LQIVGDDTLALDSVLKADVWRHKLITEEVDLSKALEELEKQTAPGTTLGEAETVRIEAEKDELTSQLGEVQRKLIEMEAETGPARASALLYGLGFNDEDQKKQTRAFSGGWRMRLALARALFVKPDLLMLDEPSNMLGRRTFVDDEDEDNSLLTAPCDNLDLNAIAWLEDYLQSWEGTILVV
jgi:ATP-binding cassette subfamily F protein 3